jgi:hypothetical protein
VPSTKQNQTALTEQNLGILLHKTFLKSKNALVLFGQSVIQMIGVGASLVAIF